VTGSQSKISGLPGVGETVAAVLRGESTPRAEVQGVLRRIGRDPLHAWLSIDAADAFRQADEVAGRLEAGEVLPLAGVVVGIKDNICQEGQPCGCASRILAGHRASYSATAVARLQAAGAITLGRTNMDEFGMGSSTENSGFGPTLHPDDPTRVPGGSSGGSAAAVAAGHVPAALGTDTGGSVRQPAAFCGLVGLKPSWGRVSRHGLVAFASSLDTIGALTRSVGDAALLMQHIAGFDPMDATSSERAPGDLFAASEAPVSGLRIGRVVFDGTEGLHPGVAAAEKTALARLVQAGASVEEVSLPTWSVGVACYVVTATAEASSNLARYDGVRYGPRPPGWESADLATLYRKVRGLFGDEVKRRILVGTFALSAGWADAYYGRAQRVRAALRAETLAALSRVDLLVCPTAPTPAFRQGEHADDPVSMYLADLFTVPASLAGLPALSVPVGRADNLPAGIQIIGRPWDEGRVLAAGRVIAEA
jgi:aspartyl-tRNA(Asn)/glutamyl-tRNA(Gln) amidotransferase subunit A